MRSLPPRADRRLLVATRSRHKLEELRALLHLPDVDLVSLDDLGIAEEAVEDAATFRGNAIAKARFYAGLSQLMVALIFFQFTAIIIILGAELNRGIMELKKLGNGGAEPASAPVEAASE